jgi:hypothetical protein
MHLIVSWMQIICAYFNNELKFLFADFKQLLFICEIEKNNNRIINCFSWLTMTK